MKLDRGSSEPISKKKKQGNEKKRKEIEEHQSVSMIC
jgi:hypothetical protein